MAKKRKQKRGGRKAGRRRGRRVSGIGSAGIPMDALGGMAGFVAAKALNGVTKKVKIFQEKPIVLALAKVGLGYYANTSGKDPFIRNMGLGAMIQGGSDALDILAPNVFKGGSGSAVEGVGMVIDLDSDLSGFDDMQVENSVSGTFEYDELSGVI